MTIGLKQEGARQGDVKMGGAKQEVVKLESATQEGFILRGAKQEGVKLEGAKQEDVKLGSAKQEGVKLESAKQEGFSRKGVSQKDAGQRSVSQKDAVQKGAMQLVFAFAAFALCFVAIRGMIAPGWAATYAAEGQSTERVRVVMLGENSIRLEWPEHETSSYGYVVQYKENDGPFESIVISSRSTTSIEFDNLNRNEVHVYRVNLRLRNGDDSPYYNEVVLRPDISWGYPYDLTVSQRVSDRVRLSWLYFGSGGAETVIERRMEGERDYHVIGSAAAGRLGFEDPDIVMNRRYTYRVMARFSHAVFSEYVQSQILSSGEAPEITSAYAISPSSVYISWSHAQNADYYVVEHRRWGDAEFSEAGIAGRNDREFVDSELMPGEKYTYRVKAVQRNGTESVYSDVVEVAAVYVDMPNFISAIAVGKHEISLSWYDYGANESSYEVWRRDQQYPDWKVIAVLPRNSTKFADNRVGPDEIYTYKIRARDAEGDAGSGFSAEAYAATRFLEAPYGLSYARENGTTITLTWRNGETDASELWIERKSGVTGAWVQAARTAGTAVERANLPADSAYVWYYRVGAYSSSDRSVAYSDYIQIGDGGAFIRGGSSSLGGDGMTGKSGIAAGGAQQATDDGGSGMESDTMLELIGIDPFAIDTLHALGIIEADGSGGIVGGGQEITRGEFTAMLVRALDPPNVTAAGSFDDVKGGHKYYKEIMQAYRMGFARAASGNSFFPDRLITREEIARFVDSSLMANGTPMPVHAGSALAEFPDRAEAPARSLAQIQSVFGERIMIGIGMGGGIRIIGADQISTREQAALVIYRYMRWLTQR